MFTSQVYTVQILCLSGIMDETHLAQEVIRKWNQENAQNDGKLFLQIPEASTPGEADVIIGIVGNYIDNAKADVIEASVKVGKKVSLFFSEYQDPENTIPAELKDVEAFKNDKAANCVMESYNGSNEFRQAIAAIIEQIH